MTTKLVISILVCFVSLSQQQVCNSLLQFCTDGEFDPTFNSFLFEGSISLFHAGMVYTKEEKRSQYQDPSISCGAHD